MFLKPDWPNPQNIHAFTTLRQGGVSLAPYHSFNLADHVEDSAEHVLENRTILKKTLNLPDEPVWITQTHSTKVIEASSKNRFKEADATFTRNGGRVCVVLTADCLPLLITDKKGREIAAIHAGWRGLLNGIISNTLQKLHSNPSQLLVWLGPAISAANYEVGPEVKEAFLQKLTDAEFAFVPSRPNAWMADLYALARLLLIKEGVSSIYGGNYCTFADKERFYSYRRDGQQTGRMASLIWISSSDKEEECVKI